MLAPWSGEADCDTTNRAQFLARLLGGNEMLSVKLAECLLIWGTVAYIAYDLRKSGVSLIPGKDYWRWLLASPKKQKAFMKK